MFVHTLVAIVLVTLLLSSSEAEECRRYSDWSARLEMMNRLRNNKVSDGNPAFKMMSRGMKTPMLNKVLCEMDKCQSMGDMDEVMHTSCSMKMAAVTMQLMMAEMKAKKAAPKARPNPTIPRVAPIIPSAAPIIPSAGVPVLPKAPFVMPFRKPMNPFFFMKRTRG